MHGITVQLGNYHRWTQDSGERNVATVLLDSY